MSVRLLGFSSNCGDIPDKDSGELFHWSNRILYCATDENLAPNQHGFRTFEQKLKTSSLDSCFGLKSTKPDGTFNEIAVDDFLNSCINREIIFKTGLGTKGLEIIGFTVLPTSQK